MLGHEKFVCTLSSTRRSDEGVDHVCLTSCCPYVSWQRVAGGAPYALLGDFNFMPVSPQYKLLTTGTLEASDPG